MPPSRRFGERGSEKWKCGAGARQPSALPRPSAAAVTHRGSADPGRAPRGAPELPPPPGILDVCDLCIPAAMSSVQVQPHGDTEPSAPREADAPRSAVKPIHCETAAVHDTPGFIFLFSFALFSCLYIGHVNTRGLSWFRRLPWLFRSC